MHQQIHSSCLWIYNQSDIALDIINSLQKNAKPNRRKPKSDGLRRPHGFRKHKKPSLVETTWEFLQRKEPRKIEAGFFTNDVLLTKIVHDTEHGADVLLFDAYPFVIIYDRKDKFVEHYEIVDSDRDLKLARSLLKMGDDVGVGNNDYLVDIGTAMELLQAQAE